MIKTIVLNGLSWTPEIIGKLYVDGSDYQSLEFWYESIKEHVKNIKNAI